MLAILTLTIPSQAANADGAWCVSFPHDGPWDLRAVGFAPAADVAVDPTDNATATIDAAEGDGSPFGPAIGIHSTADRALVVGTTITPSVRPAVGGRRARVHFTRGNQMRVRKTHAGAGQVLAGVYSFSFERRQ